MPRSAKHAADSDRDSRHHACVVREHCVALKCRVRAENTLEHKGADLMVRNTGDLSRRRVFAPIASAP
eukprot:1912908-Prymnesium_polylepis.5